MRFLRWIAELLGLYHHSFAEPERYISRECLTTADLKTPNDEAQARIARADAARERAISILGSRHVLHPQYRCRATSYEAFLKQPPSVLNSWRALHQDPRQRTVSPVETTKRRSRLSSV
jgi:hypothetical protein